LLSNCSSGEVGDGCVCGPGTLTERSLFGRASVERLGMSARRSYSALSACQLERDVVCGRHRATGSRDRRRHRWRRRRSGGVAGAAQRYAVTPVLQERAQPQRDPRCALNSSNRLGGRRLAGEPRLPAAVGSRLPCGRGVPCRGRSGPIDAGLADFEPPVARSTAWSPSRPILARLGKLQGGLHKSV